MKTFVKTITEHLCSGERDLVVSEGPSHRSPVFVVWRSRPKGPYRRRCVGWFSDRFAAMETIDVYLVVYLPSKGGTYPNSAPRDPGRNGWMTRKCELTFVTPPVRTPFLEEEVRPANRGARIFCMGGASNGFQCAPKSRPACIFLDVGSLQ